MALKNLILEIVCIALVESYILENSGSVKVEISDFNATSANIDIGANNTILIEADENNVSEAFNGVYAECFLYLSYSCIQKKTLLYLKNLNGLREISVLGEYLKFVKINATQDKTNEDLADETVDSSEDLASRIDRAVDSFFDNHVLRFKALGKDIIVPRTVNEFVGRKKRKGGGGGGGGGGHGGGHGGGGDDGGKKKMMMMAMMCMKMKLMMMVPAMMGMMGMMSFKGMIFSMMSFMMSKMMLLMKILEKKGLGGGGGGGGGDSGWAAGGGGGGGGAWMPAGGSSDYGGGGGGGGGGYDANGQWQSRSIPESNPEDKTYTIENTPEISYIKPSIRYNYIINKNPTLKSLHDEVIKIDNEPKSRKKRGLLDVIQNAYLYWINRMLGVRRYNKISQQKYKIVNGVKYVYYPLRYVKARPAKPVTPEITANDVKVEDYKPIITVQDFNKGEIVDSPAESRMTKKKFEKLKNTVNAAVDDNPWE